MVSNNANPTYGHTYSHHALRNKQHILFVLKTHTLSWTAVQVSTRFPNDQTIPVYQTPFQDYSRYVVHVRAVAYSRYILQVRSLELPSLAMFCICQGIPWYTMV